MVLPGELDIYKRLSAISPGYGFGQMYMSPRIQSDMGMWQQPPMAQTQQAPWWQRLGSDFLNWYFQTPISLPGMLAQPATQRAMEIAGVPGEYLREYWSRPLAGALTMPWVGIAKPEDPGAQRLREYYTQRLTEAESPIEAARAIGLGTPMGLVSPFMPGQPGRQAYEEWEARPYARGAIETATELPLYMAGGAAVGAIPVKGVPIAQWEARAISGVMKRLGLTKLPPTIRSLDAQWAKLKRAAKAVLRAPTAKARQAAIKNFTKQELILRDVGHRAIAERTIDIKVVNARLAEASELGASVSHLEPIAYARELSLLQRIMGKVRGRPAVPKGPALPEKPIPPIEAPPPPQPAGVELIARIQPATDWQKVAAHRIAWNKGLINPTTRAVTQSYRRLAMRLVGVSSMLKMTQEQADYFIEGLRRLVRTPSGRVRIPTGQAMLPKQLADKIPMFKDVGILERVRPAWRVLSKIGLWEEVWEPVQYAEATIGADRIKFEKELSTIERPIGKDVESRARIFQTLENELAVTELNADEAKAYKWFKDYFDKTAIELKLPLAKKRENYVTHIFERQMEKDLRSQKWLDPEFVTALDWILPQRVFNPYLRERLGKEVGLIQDPFKAARAYEYRFLRTKYYDPLVKKIRAYVRLLPGNAQNYLKDYIARITNMPLRGDLEYNRTMREFGDIISKLPKGDKLAQYFKQGNSAGLLAYHYVNMLYFLWLGFRPVSAIRNLSQQVLAVAEVGPIHFFKGAISPTARRAVKDSMVLKSRQRAYLPGIDSAFADRWSTRMREASMKMFRAADRVNVINSFKAGFHEAESLGLPYEWCVKRGDEVAAKTQYIYTKMGGAAWSQTALGRMLTPLTTWPINFLELLNDWVRGTPSEVYKAYEGATGNKVKLRMSWDKRRKSLIIFLSLVILAIIAEKKTRVKATQYTGWTSFRYLADMVGGGLAALDLPGAIAQLAAGAVTGDMAELKRGWGRLKRFRPNIVKQIEKLMSGETDWLTLFFYLNPEEQKKLPKIIPQPQRPSLGETYGFGEAYR